MAQTFLPAQPGTVSQPHSSASVSMISSPRPDSSSGSGCRATGAPNAAGRVSQTSIISRTWSLSSRIHSSGILPSLSYRKPPSAVVAARTTFVLNSLTSSSVMSVSASRPQLLSVTLTNPRARRGTVGSAPRGPRSDISGQSATGAP